jgi:hypothetical protein
MATWEASRRLCTKGSAKLISDQSGQGLRSRGYAEIGNCFVGLVCPQLLKDGDPSSRVTFCLSSIQSSKIKTFMNK